MAPIVRKRVVHTPQGVGGARHMTAVVWIRGHVLHMLPQGQDKSVATIWPGRRRCGRSGNRSPSSNQMSRHVKFASQPCLHVCAIGGQHSCHQIQRMKLD
jgi:hypothetical protein